ncbi:MAG: pseudouridine synthase [Hyphomicrobiales bacterium]|nr:pseudouridine synthase [Hyphomicrobiales bacterium]MDE2114936.1 pseudouridine synthase [Hyphomicrobiales bacterium]
MEHRNSGPRRPDRSHFSAKPARAYDGEGGGKDGQKPSKPAGQRPSGPKSGPKPGPKPGAKPTEVAERPNDAQRIAKVMARAGLCSRRDAENWIGQGRVDVNGVTLTSPAFNVTPGDRIRVDNVPLNARERTRLFAFHKPRGFVTTDRDPEGRATIFDHLADVVPLGSTQKLPRLVTIGRLDINTEGLLLLTNDGGLARVLELPSTGWLRRYRVRANGSIDQVTLNGLRDGITIDGVDYIGIEAILDRVQGANVWLTMGLREGKNREIKRVLEHLGLAVTRLIRISYGPFQLGELEIGAVEEIKTRVLRDQLGANLAAEAGADFDGPLHEAVPEASQWRAEKARPLGLKEARVQTEPDIRERPAPGPRKHVATMRAERASAQKHGERTKIQRSATEDRKGREVRVERVVAARPPREHWRGEAEPAPTRNGERFAKQRTAGQPERKTRGREDLDTRPPRRDGEKDGRFRGERRPGGDRDKPFGDKVRRPRFGEAETDTGRARPPRGEGAPERRGSGKPSFGKSGAGKPSFGKSGPGRSGSGKPRFDKPSGDRPRGKR